MNEVTQVFIQGVSSILVVLIGLAFKELKKFLETKTEHIKAKTDLEANGIHVDENTKRLLIESVVNGMNELKTINF